MAVAYITRFSTDFLTDYSPGKMQEWQECSAIISGCLCKLLVKGDNLFCSPEF